MIFRRTCQIKVAKIFLHRIENNNDEKELTLFWSYKCFLLKYISLTRTMILMREDRDPGQNRPL